MPVGVEFTIATFFFNLIPIALLTTLIVGVWVWHNTNIKKRRKTFFSYRAQCGHMTNTKGYLNTVQQKKDGTTVEVDIEIKTSKKNGGHKYCIDCLQKMVIPCAFCKCSILPDSFISCSTLKKGIDYTPPDNARVRDSDLTYGELKTSAEGDKTKLENMVLIGCTRTGCGDIPDGRWSPPGKITELEVPSILP